jgi:hypothetical protein
VQVTRTTFLPLLSPAEPEKLGEGVVWDEFSGDLAVVYTFGPPFGSRVVTQADLQRLDLSHRVLRRTAMEQLEQLAGRAQFHGQPPALMLSFEGLESSLLLIDPLWSRLQAAVPGELVIGVPARDVVIVTGSQSQSGLEKARRAVDRVFFAGDQNLLTRRLLVRRGGAWEPFERPARPVGRPGMHHGAGHHGPHLDARPRQLQEHPSWPGQRVPVAAMRPFGPVDRPASYVPRPGQLPMPRPMPAPMSAPPMSAPPMSAGPMGYPPVGYTTGQYSQVPSYPPAPAYHDAPVPAYMAEPARQAYGPSLAPVSAQPVSFPGASRPLYPDYGPASVRPVSVAPVSAQPSWQSPSAAHPTYPNSWGNAPGTPEPVSTPEAPARPAWDVRTGARARFCR